MKCARFPWKRRFDRRGDAAAAARRCWKRGSIWVREYSCPHCGGFHLTSWPES